MLGDPGTTRGGLVGPGPFAERIDRRDLVVVRDVGRDRHVDVHSDVPNRVKEQFAPGHRSAVDLVVRDGGPPVVRWGRPLKRDEARVRRGPEILRGAGGRSARRPRLVYPRVVPRLTASGFG